LLAGAARSQRSNRDPEEFGELFLGQLVMIVINDLLCRSHGQYLACQRLPAMNDLW
jgi:hypothetical protein